MTADRTHTVAGTTWTEGAAVHPRFLRVGSWVLSLVVATLFVLSFATSYAALYDYSLQLQFGREFAIVFPLVLDAVISVLAVTVLLERALRRRSVTVKGWQFAFGRPQSNCPPLTSVTDSAMWIRWRMRSTRDTFSAASSPQRIPV